MEIEKGKKRYDMYHLFFTPSTDKSIDRINEKQEMLQEVWEGICAFFTDDVLYYDYLGTCFEHDIQRVCKGEDDAQTSWLNFLKNDFAQYQDLFCKLEKESESFGKTKQLFFDARHRIFAVGHSVEEDTRREYIADYVDGYFGFLLEFLEYMNLYPMDSEVKNFVNDLMIIDCFKDSFFNKIYLSKFHPLMLLTYCEIIDFEELASEVKKQLGNVEDTLKEIFVNIASQNYSYFFNDKLIYGNRLYFYEPCRERYQKGALPLTSMCNPQERGTLTPIKSLRIIEKIVGLPDYGDVPGGAGSIIKIAVFGSFLDNEKDVALEVEKYFENCRKWEKEIPQIKIDKFDKMSSQTEDFRFCNKQDGRVVHYNLLDNGSLERLFAEYKLVLLLDMGCFYSIGNSKKTLSFEWASSRIALFRSFIEEDAYNHDYMKLYFGIYSIIQKWMFSYYESMTTQLEFNSKLFRAIDSADKKDTRVYAYISQGQKMADIDLADDNMCKYEFYNGQGLTVYRFETSDEDDYRIDKFLETKDTKVIQIPVWKFIKSVSSEFYHDIWKLLQGKGSSIEEYDFIYFLRGSYLAMDYRDCLQTNKADGTDTKLGGTVRFLVYPGQNMENLPGYDALIELLNEIIKNIFQVAFESSIPYVSKYLREISYMTFMSDAVSTEDFLFAYLIKDKLSLKVERISGEEADKYNKVRLNTDKLCYKKHKLLAKIIEELDRYRIVRDNERNVLLFSEFIVRYARPLADGDFYKVLCSIRESCEVFSYTNSELYQNTKDYH